MSCLQPNTTPSKHSLPPKKGINKRPHKFKLTSNKGLDPSQGQKLTTIAFLSPFHSMHEDRVFFFLLTFGAFLSFYLVSGY